MSWVSTLAFVRSLTPCCAGGHNWVPQCSPTLRGGGCTTSYSRNGRMGPPSRRPTMYRRFLFCGTPNSDASRTEKKPCHASATCSRYQSSTSAMCDHVGIEYRFALALLVLKWWWRWRLLLLWRPTSTTQSGFAFAHGPVEIVCSDLARRLLRVFLLTIRTSELRIP